MRRARLLALLLFAPCVTAGVVRADGPAAGGPQRPYPPPEPIEEVAVVAGVIGLSALAGALRKPR